jgi:hyperosmotically inducible periplasmic protein
MKTKLAITGFLLGALLIPTAYSEDSPKAFVKDSAITTKIKTKLAAERLSSLAKIHVETDANGVVYLSGFANSQEQIDKAVEIARSTENVRDVKNQLTVKKDD